MTASGQWVPPSAPSLRCSAECAGYAEFAAPLFRHGPWSASLQLTTSYLQSCLPPDTLPKPSTSDLLVWYSGLVQNSTDLQNLASGRLSSFRPENPDPASKALLYGRQDECVRELCSELGFTGDVELVGTGIMASYYAAAAIVTMFCLVLVYAELKTRNKGVLPSSKTAPTNQAPFLRYMINACRGALSELFISAIIFSLVILIVSIVTFIRERPDFVEVAQWQQRPKLPVYHSELTLMASSFTVFPVAALATLCSDVLGPRRWRLRYASLALLYLLLIVNVCLVLVYRLLHDQVNAIAMALGCQAKFDIFGRYAVAYSLIIIILPVTFLLPFLVLLPIQKCLAKRKRSKKPAPLVATYKAGLRWSMRIGAVGLMWLQLAVLTWWRVTIQSFAAKDARGQLLQPENDNQWSFGQILALAIWIPAVVEFLYIFAFGTKPGLDGRLPKTYELIQVANYRNVQAQAEIYAQHSGVKTSRPFS